MRIIAGKYRGRVLKSPTDLKTRPTSDRLRETLFNILTPKIHENTKFLDLCAGTGAIGIEAISRGAESVVFVDKSIKSCGLVSTNLKLLAIPVGQTEVITSAALNFAKKNGQTFDMVFFDPPYDDEYIEVISLFGERDSNLLAEDGVLIAEHHVKNLLLDEIGELRRWRIVKQGESQISFYERK
jgi:16S rRNA (guanine966-N2)-methyltransferase